MKGLIGNLIPVPHPDVLSFKESGGNYFFNPRGHSGVIVLYGQALNLWEACRGGKTVETLHKVLKFADETLVSLAEIELISLGKEYDDGLRKMRNESRCKKVSVWLNITEACNLSCAYCYVNKKPEHMSFELACSVISKLQRDAIERGFHKLVIKFAGGEPSLESKTIERIVEKFKGNGSIPIEFAIISNGTKLNDRLLYLASEGLLSVSISLDGVGSHHDIQRPYFGNQESFVDIDKNISRLAQRGLRPFILATVTELNRLGLSELADYCLDRRMPFRFSLFKSVDPEKEFLQPTNGSLVESLADCYNHIETRLPVELDMQRAHRLDEISFFVPKFRTCGLGGSGMYISTAGNVGLCQYDPEEPIVKHDRGNCFDTTMHQVRYAPDKKHVDTIETCNTCEWKLQCSAGCPIHTHRVFGMSNKPSPYCEVYKQIIPVQLRLIALQLLHKIPKKGEN